MSKIRHIPIRYKFMAVLIFIMLTGFGLYLHFSFRMFSEDKTVFIMDLNLNVLTAITHVIRQEIGVRLEYIQSFAPRIYSQTQEKGGSFEGYGTSLPGEVLALSFFRKKKDAGFELFRIYENTALLEKQNIQPAFFREKNTQTPPALDEFYRGQKLLIQNRSFNNPESGKSIGVLTILIAATSFNDKESIILVVDFLQDFLVNKLKQSDLAEVFLVSSDGSLISHSNSALVTKYAHESFSHPILERIRDRHPPKESLEVMIQGEDYLVNVGEVGISDMFLVAQIRKREAFVALRMLLIKNLILAAVILFASIAGSITFTSHVTSNIEKLEFAAACVGAGDLETKIDIRSNDEIRNVAETFRWMVDRIKQLLMEKENKVRMEGELKTAQLMQSTILAPPQVSSDSIEVVYYYDPATECAGDIWDIKIVNNKATVFLGDATGHGVAAALVTSLVKSSFSTLFTKYVNRQLNADEILDALNTIIFESCRGKLLMTMIIVQIDLRTGDTLVSSAGHENPMCLKASVDDKQGLTRNKVEVFHARGERLGYERDSIFRIYPYRMEVGDSIILYSDGLTDAMNSEGKMFSGRTLRRVLDELRGQPLTRIRNGVIESVKQHLGTSVISDDISFVIVRWKKPVYLPAQTFKKAS